MTDLPLEMIKVKRCRTSGINKLRIIKDFHHAYSVAFFMNFR